MALDGIGGGKPPGVDAIKRPQPGEAVSAGEVADAGAAEQASAAGPLQGSPELGQLQRGEVTLDQYLDRRVAEATSHLSGTLPPEQLDFVQAELRRQLEADPVLLELVRRTTGLRPSEL